MKEKIREFIKNEGIVFPKEFVLELYTQIMKFGPLAGLIQAGSKKAGQKAGQIFKSYVQTNHDSIPDVIKEFIKETGFGEIDVRWEGENLVLEVKDSFLLKAHNKPEVALRPLVGAIEGFISETLGKNTRSDVKGNVITVSVS